MKTFRWAIFGTGFAARKFVLGLKASESASAVAVVSRRLERAKHFAADFGVAAAFDSYEQAAEQKNIDAIYVATPSSLHREHALIALQAGKAVLIEKPLALDAQEARCIVAAARNSGVFCMEAMWTRFLPAVRRLKEMIQSGAIGEVVMMTAGFSIAHAVDRKTGLYDVDGGDGALLSRGIYPLSLAVHLLGIPDQVSGQAIIGPTGVDEVVTMSLRYESGALAQLHAGFRSTAPNDCWILGTKARIHLHAPIYRPFRMTVSTIHPRSIRASGDQGWLARFREGSLLQGAYQRFGDLTSPLASWKSKVMTFHYKGNGYHYEADAVRLSVNANILENSIMSLSESVRIMEIVDCIRDQWTARLVPVTE